MTGVLDIDRHPELVSGSSAPLRRTCGRKAEAYRKIMPIGVEAFNQVDLPLPVPALQLLFAGDGRQHFVKSLEIDEAIDAISLRKARLDGGTMRPEPSDQIGRDTDVHGSTRLACKDVDAGLALVSHDAEPIELWTLKQVQGDGSFLSKFSPSNSDLKKAFV
ncbi:MAG: hypothetical protein RLZZ561_742 [Pseudomonadota bacterium]|jgi:hypothetical protein